jgi:hypothetical protein
MHDRNGRTATLPRPGSGDWLWQREIIRRGQDRNSAPGMHREQMAPIAAHDDIGATGGNQRQVLVVLGVATRPYGLDGLNSGGGDNHQIQDKPSSFDRNITIELETEYDLPPPAAGPGFPAPWRPRNQPGWSRRHVRPYLPSLDHTMTGQAHEA